MIDIFDIKYFLLDVIKEAGKIMMEGQMRKIQISSKSNVNDLVTEYDVMVENFIIEKIKVRYPTHSILGEESGNQELNGDFTWIIDPIDGTVNYAHHIPLFSCSIALLYKNELQLGAIYNPASNELFHAMKDHGAYLNEDKIFVSTNEDFKRSLLVTGFSYQATQSPYTFPLFEKIVSQNIPIRRLGSAALDLAYVACGRFDGFWEEGLKPWDIAAGYLIVKEAGGKITDFNNVEGTIFQKSTWVSNGKIHDEFLRTLYELGYKKEM